MTLQHELPDLLDELADSRPVGDPPRLDHLAAVGGRTGSQRPHPWSMVAAVAACVAVGVAGVVAVVNRGDDVEVSTSAWTPPESMPTATWVAFPTLPITERFAYTATATDDGVFVWGGCCEPDTLTAPDSTALHDGAYFDTGDGEWHIIPEAPLDDSRGDAISAWNGSEVIVLNGIGQIQAAAFDPTSLTWREITAPDGDAATSATTHLYPLPDGHVAFVVTNYEDGLGNGVRVQIYDPTTDAWTPGAEPRADLSYGTSTPDAVHGSAVNGTTIAVLSSTRQDCGTATVDTYDTATREWSTFESIAHPSGDWTPTAIVGIDTGRFLILGGPCDGQPQRLAAILDPSDGTVTAAADTPVALRGGFLYDMTWTGTHAVRLNGDGRLLAYDPASDLWISSDPIPTPDDTGPDAGIGDVPVVVLDQTLITPAIATTLDLRGCCQPIPAGWTYRLG